MKLKYEQHLAEQIRSGDVTAAVFDFDGTIYPSTAGIERQLKPLMLKHAARWLEIDEEAAKVVLRQYRAVYKSGVLGLHAHHGVDPTEFYRGVYDELDLSNLVGRPGLELELEVFGEQVALYVLTNSNATFTHRALRMLSLGSQFRHVFTVEDNGFLRKPETEVYRRLFERLQLEPARVVLFDDIPSSLKVGQTLGAATVLVGNGLGPDGGFVDLHTGEVFIESPPFVDASTQNIVRFLAELNNRTAILERG